MKERGLMKINKVHQLLPQLKRAKHLPETSGIKSVGHTAGIFIERIISIHTYLFFLLKKLSQAKKMVNPHMNSATSRLE